MQVLLLLRGVSMLESWEWLRSFWTLLEKPVDALEELVKHCASTFVAADPQKQVIYLLVALLALALLVFFAKLSASKAASPFRIIPAPRVTPQAPPWYSIEKRLEYYITRRYFSHCRPNSIGWFAPRLLIWIGSFGIFGCFMLKLSGVFGLKLIDDVTYGFLYFAVLSTALLVAYAHNTRRLVRLNRPRVPFLKFSGVFALPLAMTGSVVIFELSKHHAVVAFAWIYEHFPLA